MHGLQNVKKDRNTFTPLSKVCLSLRLFYDNHNSLQMFLIYSAPNCTQIGEKNVENGFKIVFNAFKYATLRLYMFPRISHCSDIKLKYLVPKCTEIGQKLAGRRGGYSFTPVHTGMLISH